MPDKRVWTIPNVISVVRLLLVPVFVWLLFKNDSQPVAAGVLLYEWVRRKAAPDGTPA